MSTEKSQSKVLIIGGGPAGLTLGQILRKHNISCRVYERDGASGIRRQGWAVMLMECLGKLMKLLPEDLGDLRQVSVNHNTGDGDSISVFNALNMELFASFGGAPPGSPGFGIRASREHLRKFLLQKLDVQEGKSFDRYEEDESGVTAFFKDGTSARGDVLIGAEGGHSRIRSQLLNERPVLTHHINIIGETEVGPEIYEPVRKRGHAAVIGVQQGFRVFIGQQYMKPDRSAAGFYWMVVYHSDNPEQDNKWASTASKQELFDRAMGIMKDTSPLFVDTIRAMGPESVSTDPIKYIEYVPPESVPKGRVILIGDALHTMIPFRAAGANTALLDSCDLGQLIIDSQKNNQNIDWAGVFDQFHAIALPRGRDAVLSSRAAGESVGNAQSSSSSMGSMGSMGGK